MPDHVASASMWPHFPDEAIIILIIMVIMAFEVITIHHPQPGRKMLILYDVYMSRMLHCHYYWGEILNTKSACVPEKIQILGKNYTPRSVCKGLTVFDIGEAVSEVEVFS